MILRYFHPGSWQKGDRPDNGDITFLFNISIEAIMSYWKTTQREAPMEEECLGCLIAPDEWKERGESQVPCGLALRESSSAQPSWKRRFWPRLWSRANQCFHDGFVQEPEVALNFNWEGVAGYDILSGGMPVTNNIRTVVSFQSRQTGPAVRRLWDITASEERRKLRKDIIELVDISLRCPVGGSSDQSSHTACRYTFLA